MAKLRVQAQHLQAGDIVGSGQEVHSVVINSINWPSNKVCVYLNKDRGIYGNLWGKYTMIGIERAEKVNENN